MSGGRVERRLAAILAVDVAGYPRLMGEDEEGTLSVARPNGRRPLNYAAIRNDTAMIKALLDAGANINSANRSGFTPLHHAGEAGSKEAATLLITNGANLTLRNMYEQTPEQTATASHHPEVAEILLQAMTRSR
jgi:ankyrin repeat protein